MSFYDFYVAFWPLCYAISTMNWHRKALICDQWNWAVIQKSVLWVCEEFTFLFNCVCKTQAEPSSVCVGLCLLCLIFLQFHTHLFLFCPSFSFSPVLSRPSFQAFNLRVCSLPLFYDFIPSPANAPHSLFNPTSLPATHEVIRFVGGKSRHLWAEMLETARYSDRGPMCLQMI